MGSNLSTRDLKCRQTPRVVAVVGGHAGVVKLLKQLKDLNSDTRDTEHGQTPLFWEQKDRNPRH